MSTAPPPEVLSAVYSGSTSITRRIELYQADGSTKWDPEGDNEYQPRLIDGSVSVDYTRDERRSADLQLDNRDNLLRPEPNRGLWYDKIIKAYRGVRYPTDPRPPKIVIIEELTTNSAYELREILVRMGYSRTDVRTNFTTLAEVKSYDIIVSYMKTGKTVKAGLLQQAFNSGKSVFTLGNDFSSTELPFVLASTPVASRVWNINPALFDSPLAGGWVSQATPTADAGVLLTVLDGATYPVATDLSGATTHYTAMVKGNDAGGRWFHFHPHVIGTQGKILIAKGVEWLRNFTPYREWECQIGEFMIDSLSQANRPKIIKISSRDYAKKMLNSKLEKSASFAAGTPLEVLVKAMAANAGITKLRIPVSGKTLPSRVDIERGTERWRVAKDACNANSFELFFDAQGYLVMRPFLDPSFSPVAHVFKTGPLSEGGNLVSFERSTNDSRLYNHVVVTGEREGDGVLPFFGEAKNTTADSPTRIARIGDRSYFYTSSYFTSNAQCLETAHNLLKLQALESYEMNFSSINFHWLEVGEITEMLDPDALDIDPTRFLLDTLSIPMGLGAMSGTSKRVTFVQDDDYIAALNALESDVGEEPPA